MRFFTVLKFISFKKILFCYDNYIVQMLAYILNTQLQTMSEVLRLSPYNFLGDRKYFLL